MTRFFLIRHATTIMVGKRLAGRMRGVPLNEEGNLQAEALAERLKGITFHAIYSSPLERAVSTAGAVAALHHLQCGIWDDFTDIEFGEWTDCSFEDLANLPQFQRFNLFRSSTRIPGGESMLEAQARMIAGLEKLRALHPQETVAVVSHADLIKAAVAYYAGIHLDMFQRVEISPASVSVVELGNDTARILLVNDTGMVNL